MANSLNNNVKNKYLFLFAGLPGSGKSTVIDAIEDLGKVITMGDVIREEAEKRQISSSDENFGKIAKELREKYGPEVIAEKCVELIKNKEDNVIIIDGLRSTAELEVFKRIWKCSVIAIIASKEVRFQRISKRERIDDTKTLDDLNERDQREIKFGLEEVIENAEYKIDNNSSIEESIKNARKLVRKIIKNY